jgi:hypothetical protein
MLFAQGVVVGMGGGARHVGFGVGVGLRLGCVF